MRFYQWKLKKISQSFNYLRQWNNQILKEKFLIQVLYIKLLILILYNIINIIYN